MPDESDPPRKFYGLKPREFERVNEPAPGVTPPPEPAVDPGIVAHTDRPIDVRELARVARGGQAALGTNAAQNRENEVHGILKENHAWADAMGLNKVSLAPKPRSRRRRDYFVLLAAGNLFIVGVFFLEIFLGFQVMCLAAQMPQEFSNLVRYALGVWPMFAMVAFGIFAYSCMLTWLMFGVMSDY